MAATTVIAGGFALGPLLTGRAEMALASLIGIAGFALFFAGPPPRGTFDDRLTRLRILESFTALDPGRSELLQLGAEAESASDRLAWERTVEHYRLADRR
jgi:hypothetical protein